MASQYIQIPADSAGGGSATAARQDTGNTSLASIDGKVPAKGTAAMAASTPVTLATDDTAVKALAPPAASDTPAAITAGAVTQFASVATAHGIIVQNDTTSTTNIRVGDSGITAARGIQVAPGKAIFLPCTNANVYYHIAESGSPKINLARF